MKRILVQGAAVASLLATNAFAADLPARIYAKAPPMVDPGINWTGFYAGLNGGYSWGRANTTLLPASAFAPQGQNVNGGLAGGQAGYDWQLERNWVIGLEGDIQWTGERSSASRTSVGPRFGAFQDGTLDPSLGPDFNAIATQAANFSYNLEWFATFRGRAGVLADPRTLLYATGGLAVGAFKYSSQTTLSTQVFTPGIAGTTPFGAPIVAAGATTFDSQTRVGWTLGAGIERKFSANWSAKLEYLYLDFGSKTYLAGTAGQADVSFHDHIFRAGINYAFNPGPVVAKY
jgi:outer membrane immunogenic protein